MSNDGLKGQLSSYPFLAGGTGVGEAWALRRRLTAAPGRLGRGQRTTKARAGAAESLGLPHRRGQEAVGSGAASVAAAAE